jgi:hypothetical protein
VPFMDLNDENKFVTIFKRWFNKWIS